MASGAMIARISRPDLTSWQMSARRRRRRCAGWRGDYYQNRRQLNHNPALPHVLHCGPGRVHRESCFWHKYQNGKREQSGEKEFCEKIGGRSAHRTENWACLKVVRRVGRVAGKCKEIARPFSHLPLSFEALSERNGRPFTSPHPPPPGYNRLGGYALSSPRSSSLQHLLLLPHKKTSS